MGNESSLLGPKQIIEKVTKKQPERKVETELVTEATPKEKTKPRKRAVHSSMVGRI
jgi:hypothetical protein